MNRRLEKFARSQNNFFDKKKINAKFRSASRKPRGEMAHNKEKRKAAKEPALRRLKKEL